MSRQTRENRKAPPIDSWEAELNGVLRDPARSTKFSQVSVRSYIRRQPVRAVDGIYAKVSLQCPLGRGARIEIPVRSQNCEHLQCFDLATYLKMHDRKLLAVKRHGTKLLHVDASVDKKYISWDCPICKKHAGVRDLHVDGYFNSVLLQYNTMHNVEEVEIKSDGSHRAIVRPKVEVFPVSDSPFIQANDGGTQAQTDEKPLAPDQPNVEEEAVSADAMEITDLTLEQIRRLPETHQLCKEVKRRLLNNYKHKEKKKVLAENPSDAASATTTLMVEGLGSSDADDATLSSGGGDYTQLTQADDAPLLSGSADDAPPPSSGDGAEQAQTSKTEVERLRRALADAEHAELMLHAENKQLQAKLLVRQKTVQANEQDEAQLREKNRGLEMENTMLRIKLASKTALAARRAQQASLAKEKAQKMQSENDKLQETLADKERTNMAQSGQITRLESSLRDTQARADSTEREWSQLRVVNEGLLSENANLRRRNAELEASASSSRTGKRQATGEGGGVSSKRGKIEDGGQLMCISNIDKNANEEGGSAGSSGPPGVSAAPKPSARLQVLLQMYIDQFIAEFFAPLNNIIRRSERRFRVKDNREERLASVEAAEETAAPPLKRPHVGPADERYVVLRRPPPDTLKSGVKHRDDVSDRHRHAKRIMMEQNAQVHFGIRNPSLGFPVNRRFTKEVSFEPEDTEGMSHAVFSLPCSDSPVQGRSRWQPDKSVHKKTLKANVRMEIGKMVAHFQQMKCSGGMQYWLITDMLLKGLDETVVNHRSNLITRIEFPQLPIWITDGLRALQKVAVDITLTHVFLCLGFDLRFCYCGPTDTIVGMVVDEIERIIEWWEKSLVGRDVMSVREASTADVSVTCKIELPRFVLFTIPEVGDWNKGWRSVNENYRKWAEDYNRRHSAVVDTVEILDWAKMCEDKWGEKGQHRSTFEERVKLLMEHCNSEYGMLLERNNVDLVQFRRQLR